MAEVSRANYMYLGKFRINLNLFKTKQYEFQGEDGKIKGKILFEYSI